MTSTIPGHQHLPWTVVYRLMALPLAVGLLGVAGCASGTGTAKDYRYELWTGDTSGTQVGSDKNPNVAIAATETEYSVTWDAGDHGLTSADVKASDFGAAYRAYRTAGSINVRVDYITLEIEYTVPPPTALFKGRGPAATNISPFCWIAR